MTFHEFYENLKSDVRRLKILKILFIAGFCLILISYFFSGGGDDEKKSEKSAQPSESVSEYRDETERRLTDFLRNIEGVGEVKVYLTYEGEKEYVYAREGRTSVSENKKEEEYKYVMTGGSSDKTALVETVKLPEVKGAVIACSGSENAAVCQSVYKAAATALGIPTSCIYVTKLR